MPTYDRHKSNHVRIVAAGPLDARVWLNGEELRMVKGVSFDVGIERMAELTVTLLVDAADIDADVVRHTETQARA